MDGGRKKEGISWQGWDRTSPAVRSHAWPLLPATPNALRSPPNFNPNAFLWFLYEIGLHKNDGKIRTRTMSQRGSKDQLQYKTTTSNHGPLPSSEVEHGFETCFPGLLTGQTPFARRASSQRTSALNVCDGHSLSRLSWPNHISHIRLPSSLRVLSFPLDATNNNPTSVFYL